MYTLSAIKLISSQSIAFTLYFVTGLALLWAAERKRFLVRGMLAHSEFFFMQSISVIYLCLLLICLVYGNNATECGCSCGLICARCKNIYQHHNINYS